MWDCKSLGHLLEWQAWFIALGGPGILHIFQHYWYTIDSRISNRIPGDASATSLQAPVKSSPGIHSPQSLGERLTHKKGKTY